MNKLFRGIALCVSLAALAVVLGPFAPVLGGVLICLLLGTTLRSMGVLSADFSPGINFCAKSVLVYAVVLMGLMLKTETLVGIGSTVFLALVVVVVVSIGASALLYRLLKVDRATGLLLGIGSGICGSAAIATCSSFITKDDSKVASALGVINFVGILSLSAISIVATFSGFSETQSSVLIGGTLQSVGHVAAAGGVLGPQVLSSALAIKMGRVFLLLPTVIGLSLLSPSNGRSSIKSPPVYLWGFIAAMILTNVPGIPESIVNGGVALGKYLLMVAVVGIGYDIDLKSFFRQAPRLILFAIVLQLLEIAVLLPILF
jgi:uncharacterized integral membrane protein (TIGR00698 family)